MLPGEVHCFSLLQGFSGGRSRTHARGRQFIAQLRATQRELSGALLEAGRRIELLGNTFELWGFGKSRRATRMTQDRQCDDRNPGNDLYPVVFHRGLQNERPKEMFRLRASSRMRPA